MGDAATSRDARADAPPQSFDSRDPQVAPGDAEQAPALFDRRIDLAVAVALTLVGIAIIALAGDIRDGSVPDPIGSRGLPTILGGFLAVTGAILVVRRLASWRRTADHRVPAEGGTVDEPHHPGSAVRPFAILAGGVAWVSLLEQVGYLPTTIALGVAVLAAMGVRSVVRLLLIPVGFALLTWLLFTQLLGIRMPAGQLW